MAPSQFFEIKSLSVHSLHLGLAVMGFIKKNQLFTWRNVLALHKAGRYSKESLARKKEALLMCAPCLKAG